MHRKLRAAAVIFSIYYVAPYVMGGRLDSEQSSDQQPNPKAKRFKIAMHAVAFSAGVVAAYWALPLAAKRKHIRCLQYESKALAYGIVD